LLLTLKRLLITTLTTTRIKVACNKRQSIWWI